MQLFDVAMFEHFAILIGYDAHKLIYHSVYKGQIKNLFKYKLGFENE